MSSPDRSRALRSNSSRFAASRIADVATGRTSSTPVARQKCANRTIVSSARSIGASCSAPDASSPSPSRTLSWISSVRFHQRPGTHVKTTRRKELEPRSMTASRRSLTSCRLRIAAGEDRQLVVRLEHESRVVHLPQRVGALAPGRRRQPAHDVDAQRNSTLSVERGVEVAVIDEGEVEQRVVRPDGKARPPHGVEAALELALQYGHPRLRPGLARILELQLAQLEAPLALELGH